MDCSLPGSSVHGILQARILQWVAISFSIYLSFPIYSLVILGKVFNHSEPGPSPQCCHEHQLSWCEALKIERMAHRLVVTTGLHQCEPEPVCADCTAGSPSACTSLPKLGCRCCRGWTLADSLCLSLQNQPRKPWPALALWLLLLLAKPLLCSMIWRDAYLMHQAPGLDTPGQDSCQFQASQLGGQVSCNSWAKSINWKSLPGAPCLKRPISAGRECGDCFEISVVSRGVACCYAFAESA